jgi:hypothetical protein
MSVLLTLIFFSLSFISGWLLTTWLELRAGLEKMGTSMLLGLWLITLAMMLSYHVTGSFNREITLGLGVGVNILLLLVMGRDQRQALKQEVLYLSQHLPQRVRQYKQQWSILNRLESLLLVVITFILGLTGLSNLTWPVSDWDSIALYDFRAILIQKVGNWVDGKKLGYFYHYPPFTSLLHGAVYLMGMEQVKIIYSLLFLSFLIVFYAFLRRQTQRFQSIIGIFLLTLAPLVSDHLTVAYTNLPYTIYFCLGIMYIWRWLTEQESRDMKLAFLFTAAACWVRASEPFWVIAFVMLLGGRLLVVRNIKWRTVLLFSGLFLILVRYWPEFFNFLDLPLPPPVANQATGLIDAVNPATLIIHAFTVSSYLFTNAILPMLYLIIPTVIVLLWDYKLKQTRFYRFAVISLLLLGGSIAAGTYFFSFTYNSWDEIGPSLTRMVMSIVPLLVYLISVSSFWETIIKYVAFSPTTQHKPKPR